MTLRYADTPGVRWTLLRELLRSPRHYLHARDNPHPATPAMLLGSAIHALALEPEREDELIAVHTETRSRATKAYKAWAAEHDGKLLLLPDEYEVAQAVAVNVRWHPIAGPMIEQAQCEVPLQWEDPGTGLPCKARVDVLGDGIADLKTTGQITPDELRKTVARFSLHGQLAHYLAGCDAQGTVLARAPALIFAETSAPYEVVVAEVNEDVVAQGRRLRDALLARLAQLQDTPEEQWPGVVDDVMVIDSLPAWAA